MAKAKLPIVRPNPAAVLTMLEDDDNAGFCLGCGAEAYGVEPDARGYVCESCGQPRVYGAEELLIMGFAD